MTDSEEHWYNPETPTDKDVEDLWPVLFEKIRTDVRGRVHEDRHEFLDARGPEDLHISITSVEIIEEDNEENLAEHLREMPTFDTDDQEEDESPDTNTRESETEGAENTTEEEPEEEGGIILEDSEISLTERSRLLLCIEIREYCRGIVTGGIRDANYRVIEVEHHIGMSVIKTLTADQRRMLADILLYQSAQATKREDLDDEGDEWMDLRTVIDTHLDMPNMRKFYREIAGIPDPS